MWKNVHALLNGLAVTILVAVAGYLPSVDWHNVTSSPLVLTLIGAAVAALSKLLGVLVAKLGGGSAPTSGMVAK